MEWNWVNTLAFIATLYFGARAAFKNQPVEEQNRDLLLVLYFVIAFNW